MLIAIAPQVGGPKLVAAAPELMVALGLTLPDGHVTRRLQHNKETMMF